MTEPARTNEQRWVKPSRAAWACLVVAIALFVGLGWRLAGTLPAWSEEIATLPSSGYRSIEFAPDREVPERKATCPEPNAPSVVGSSMRPVLSFCAGKRSWPLLIMPYASGLPYWGIAAFEPLHRGEIFGERRVGLLLGVFGLLLTFELVRRLVDAPSAVFSVLVLACLSSFVHSHVLAVYYEVLPWHALALAALALHRLDGAATARRRLLLTLTCAGSVGLALLGNAKAVLLIAPVALVALRGRRVLPRLAARHWAIIALGALAGSAPMLIYGRLEPGRGLGAEASTRLGFLLQNLRFEKLGAELANVFVFAADLGFYADVVQGLGGTPFWPACAVAACGFAYVSFSLAVWLRRGQGPWLAAACGALLWSQVFVAALLYSQSPSASYAPVCTGFGVALGLALGALQRRLGVRAAAPAALVCCGLLLTSVVRRGETPMSYVGSTNASAERDMASYLKRAPGLDRGTLLTATYALAGVFDSLGQGELSPTQTHVFLMQRCSPNDTDCLGARWRALLDDEVTKYPLRVLLPLVTTLVDEPAARHLRSSLSESAAASGRDLRVEHVSRTARGVPVLELVLIEQPLLFLGEHVVGGHARF